MCSDQMLIYASDGVVAWGYLLYVERSDSIVVLGLLLCVGRVRVSDRGNLATARGWRWRLTRGEWCL